MSARKKHASTSREFSVFQQSILVAVVALCLTSCPASQDDQPTIQGAWQPQQYFLKNGSRHAVDGLIFFTEKDWTVLFFVLGENGNPERGSGEGGTYTLHGNRLVFTHRYNLSGGGEVGSLAASPLSMEIRKSAEAPREECTVELSDERLTIFFPSGNSMVFQRSSYFNKHGTGR